MKDKVTAPDLARMKTEWRKAFPSAEQRNGRKEIRE